MSYVKNWDSIMYMWHFKEKVFTGLEIFELFFSMMESKDFYVSIFTNDNFHILIKSRLVQGQLGGICGSIVDQDSEE